MDDLASLGRLLEEADLSYAVIGAHAVNVWVAPRFTADLDVTVQADPSKITALKDLLESAGYKLTFDEGANQSSGPDFLRFAPKEGTFLLEVQVAKTDFQDQVLERARETGAGLRVATPEDLIVMKLIAYRSKDRVDLAELAQLPEIDWPYVESWADQWQVRERLDLLRSSLD